MKTSLINYLEETVKRCPNRVAVWDAGKDYTFREVFTYAQDLANRIHAINGEKGRIVAVYLDKCVAVNIADFGILMTGSAFMNMDVKTPLDRIKGIFDIVEPIVVVTSEKYKSIIAGVWDGDIIDVDITLDKNVKEMECVDKWHFFGHNMIDSDPFCIINTSGSTGVPKSVITPWRCFHNFVLWSIEEVGMRQDQEISASLAPIFFDSWVQDILLMAVNGLTQIQIPDSYRMFPVKVLQLMQEKQVTYLLWVPTIMVMIANSGLVERFPIKTLRHCWFA